MNAPHTTSPVQIGRRWVMIGFVLITIAFSAPGALADHMGNHQRPLEESTPAAATCGNNENASSSMRPSQVTGLSVVGRPW